MINVCVISSVSQLFILVRVCVLLIIIFFSSGVYAVHNLSGVKMKNSLLIHAWVMYLVMDLLNKSLSHGKK